MVAPVTLGRALEREDDVALERAALADRVDLLVRARLDADARDIRAQQPHEVLDLALLSGALLVFV